MENLGQETKPEQFEFLDQANIEAYYSSGFKELVGGLAEQHTPKWLIREAISNEVDTDDDVYFKFVQIALNGARDLFADRGQDQDMPNLADALYKGVNSRADKDPSFAKKFVQFCPELLEFSAKQGGHPNRLVNTLKTCLRLRHAGLRDQLTANRLDTRHYWLDAADSVYMRKTDLIAEGVKDRL